MKARSKRSSRSTAALDCLQGREALERRSVQAVELRFRAPSPIAMGEGWGEGNGLSDLNGAQRLRDLNP